MISLWPEGIEAKRVNSPVAILRAQAAILAEKTKNIVKATVEERHRATPDSFEIDFIIVGPALGNYRYKLFTMIHDISLYPVRLELDEAVQTEIARKYAFEFAFDKVAEAIVATYAKTEQEFLDVLKATFGTTKAVNVITAILSQTDPNWRPEEEIPVQQLEAHHTTQIGTANMDEI